MQNYAINKKRLLLLYATETSRTFIIHRVNVYQKYGKTLVVELFVSKILAEYFTKQNTRNVIVYVYNSFRRLILQSKIITQ